MNNNGNFNNGPPTALMSYPFPVHNPTQHPSLMEQAYQNQVPQDFQPQTSYFYNPGPIVCLIDFIFKYKFSLKKIFRFNHQNLKNGNKKF